MSRLEGIKILHTVVWAVFAGAIVAIPAAALMRRFDWAVGLTVLVLVECLILAVNRGRCPLTDVAARHTEDRSENFDIYLPRLIARHNKTIFGTLFFAGEVFAIWCWTR